MTIPNEIDPHWQDLDELLRPLYDAGWTEQADSTFSEVDQEAGHILLQSLHRSCMVLGVAYRPDQRKLTFEPAADESAIDDFGLGEYDMIDDEVVVSLPAKMADRRAAVRERARQLGLLDPTRFQIDGVTPEERAGIRGRLYLSYMLTEAAAWRGESVSTTSKRLLEDRLFVQKLDWLGFAGRDVLPDGVPMAAALGIVIQCWRNTEVENWHSKVTDEVMAKCNIATTRAVLPHIDVESGVDWDAVTGALTDPDRTLPDGRSMASLFREGWQPTLTDVAGHLNDWRHLQNMLGPIATLRFLSLQGSTSYTSQWWGNGWWPDICQTTVDGIMDAGLRLPTPYDKHEASALLTDLVDAPDLLSDETLKFCLFPPRAANGELTRGLGFSDVAGPPVRTIYVTDHL